MSSFVEILLCVSMRPQASARRALASAASDVYKSRLSTGPPRPAQLTHQHREHPGANTQAPPAHTQRTTQCRHTPLRDSTRSREHPRVVSAPRSASQDLNLRPLRPERSALPNCATRRKRGNELLFSTIQFSFPLVGSNCSTLTRHCQNRSRVCDRPHNTPLLTLP